MEKIFTPLFRLISIAILSYYPHCVFAEFHGTITGTTNYVWRMYSKSNNKPAIQANLDYQHSIGFYTGVTASSFNIGSSELDDSLEFEGSAQAEIIPYVGWNFKPFDDWRVDLQYSHYFYDGFIYTLEGEYDEFYLFLHYKDLLSFQTSYAKDFYGLIGDAYFYELTGRYPITDFLEASGSFGYANTKSVLSADYTYWNIGFTGKYKFIALDLRYYEAGETNIEEELEFLDHPHTQKGTIVFSISAGF
ncbi:MAG: hypothetical protein IPN42_16225 [Methylococcaceae bacterium]|nr:hypothetical protein [Methylococcaceae bacterium]